MCIRDRCGECYPCKSSREELQKGDQYERHHGGWLIPVSYTHLAFNVWTIYFYNKLLLEVANNKEEEEKPSIDPVSYTHLDVYKRHVCDTCNNATDLLDMMRKKSYDLLITDLKMAEVNGIEILEMMRMVNVRNSKTIPVIVMTAAPNVSEQELLGAGFVACLFKPCLLYTSRCV